MEDKYKVLLTSDNSCVVCNTTVWDHTTGSSLQGEHLLPKHSLPCWQRLPTISSPRQATPERVAGEQVGAVPFTPLHLWACVSHGCVPQWSLSSGRGGGEHQHLAGGDRGLAGGGDQALPASHRAAVHWFLQPPLVRRCR